MCVYDSECYGLYYDLPKYNRNCYSVAIFTLELIADLDTGRRVTYHVENFCQGGKSTGF